MYSSVAPVPEVESVQAVAKVRSPEEGREPELMVMAEG